MTRNPGEEILHHVSVFNTIGHGWTNSRESLQPQGVGKQMAERVGG